MAVTAPARIVINGFGRIGRTFVRRAAENSAVWANNIAVNDLVGAETLVHLLKYDSNHGVMNRTVTCDADNIYVDGKAISVTSIRDPLQAISMNSAEGSPTLLIDSTGIFSSKYYATACEADFDNLIVTWPDQGANLHVIMGVNDNLIDPHVQKFFSTASPSANAAVPVLKVLNEEFGLDWATVGVTCPMTNDQRIVDLPHKDPRRARSASDSIIPVPTGIASYFAAAPELTGKVMPAQARRVPVTLGLLAEITAKLSDAPAGEAGINEALIRASKVKGSAIGTTEEEIVSTDLRHEPLSLVPSLVDLGLTRFWPKEGLVSLSVWQNNEMGYVTQLIRLTEALMRYYAGK